MIELTQIQIGILGLLIASIIALLFTYITEKFLKFFIFLVVITFLICFFFPIQFGNLIGVLLT